MRERKYRIEIIVTTEDGEDDFEYSVERQDSRDSTVWDVLDSGSAESMEDAAARGSQSLVRLTS